MNNAVEIKENLYWVGARDYDIEVFDIVMHTKNGTTYNSYLLKGSEKTALIEICKAEFFDEFIERISSVCDVKDIDYVITNHTEPDHVGCINKLVELNPNIVINGSPVAMNFLSEIAQIPLKKCVVREGDVLSLGNYNLEFIQTPHLHWPDSMMTYCREIKTIFTCDMFGSHFASQELFDDLIETDFIPDYKYYYEAIFGPFKQYVLNAIEKIEKLDFDVILNGHGPLLRKDIKKYLDLYKEWSHVHVNEKPMIVMPYVSAYGYTKILGDEIKKGILSVGNIDCFDFDLVTDDMNEVKEKIEICDGVLFGSPTILSDALPPIMEVVNVLNPIVHKGKQTGAYGSFGWSGEAVDNIASRLKSLKLEMPVETIKVRFKPSTEEVQQAFEYGKGFAEVVVSKFNEKNSK